MTNLWGVVLILGLVTPAFADDGLVLDEGVELERTHRLQNGIAAGVTGSLLAYESVVLIKGAMETESSGGFVDFSAFSRGVGYTLGGLAGIGSLTMFGLMIHDVVSTPVADARETYRSGDHMSATSSLADRGLSRRNRTRRVMAWVDLGLSAGLVTFGAAVYSDNPDLGKANLWVGGTLLLVNTTVLLHTRTPVAKRTYGRFTFGVTPTGVAGVF